MWVMNSFSSKRAVRGGDAVRAVTPGAALRPDHLLHEARGTGLPCPGRASRTSLIATLVGLVSFR